MVAALAQPLLKLAGQGHGVGGDHEARDLALVSAESLGNLTSEERWPEALDRWQAGEVLAGFGPAPLALGDPIPEGISRLAGIDA